MVIVGHIPSLPRRRCTACRAAATVLRFCCHLCAATALPNVLPLQPKSRFRQAVASAAKPATAATVLPPLHCRQLRHHHAANATNAVLSPSCRHRPQAGLRPLTPFSPLLPSFPSSLPLLPPLRLCCRQAAAVAFAFIVVVLTAAMPPQFCCHCPFYTPSGPLAGPLLVSTVGCQDADSAAKQLQPHH